MIGEVKRKLDNWSTDCGIRKIKEIKKEFGGIIIIINKKKYIRNPIIYTKLP